MSVREGFFPVKERIFRVTENLFSVTGITKNTIDFPVNERIFLDCVFLTSLVIGYNFTWIIVSIMMRFFPLFRAKLFTRKLGFPEISNFIPPC